MADAFFVLSLLLFPIVLNHLNPKCKSFIVVDSDKLKFTFPAAVVATA